MKLNRIKGVVVSLFLLASVSNAQKTEITVTLNEQFFDALLDAVFQHAGAPEFPLVENNLNRRDAETSRKLKIDNGKLTILASNLHSPFSIVHSPFFRSASPRLGGKKTSCKQSIRIQRENNGVRTAVRFRDGKILAPLAFTGSYSPPFVGCVDFAGLAETKIDVEFDGTCQRLIARAKVLNVVLNGTGGIGGSVIAKLVQGSLDKKINPIEILRLDKLSFAIPIQNSGKLSMKAVGIRTGIETGVLNVHVAYEFVK